MYIPRPAKLLFTTDDGWNLYIDKHGDTISPLDPPLRRAHARLRHRCNEGEGILLASPDCTHSRFFCQTCKSKSCSSCGHKAT